MQLNQVREELDQLVLADEQKQQLLEIRNKELQSLQVDIQALQQELQPKLNHLEEQLKTREQQLRDSRDDAKLTLVQLHQAQEETERLFLTDRQKQHLLERRDQELQSLQADIQALQRELQPKVSKLEEQLKTREQQLRDSHDDAELTRHQMRQVQKEMGQLLLADRQKQQLLENRNQELQSLQGDHQALQQQQQSREADLEQQLQSRDRDLRDVRAHSDLTRLQLHQVQEELERYFLQTRAGSQLVEAQKDQLNRAKRLISKLAMSDFSPTSEVSAVAVEVLPADPRTSLLPSLQMQALLNAYASSLDRANELLTKAMRR